MSNAGGHPWAHRFEVRSEALTDPGAVRSTNQDSLIADDDLGLWLVADGMGGHEGGEEASRIAVRVFHAVVVEGRAGGRKIAPADLLAGAAQRAHCEIEAWGATRKLVRPPATTVAVALRDNDVLWIGHLGDSRVWRLRHGALEQLTRDHSVVRDLVDCGEITEAEAERHPLASRITRCLGCGGIGAGIELRQERVEPGDILLLASDGLPRVVGPEEIRTVLAGERTLQSRAKELVGTALDFGAPDNVTVVVLEVGEKRATKRGRK